MYLLIDCFLHRQSAIIPLLKNFLHMKSIEWWSVRHGIIHEPLKYPSCVKLDARLAAKFQSDWKSEKYGIEICFLSKFDPCGASRAND